MPAILPKFSLPVPANKSGQAFSSADELLSLLGGESTGQFLVGSQGMWHGGIHITDATIPWCALSTDSAEEQAYYNGHPHKGEQFLRCMADGEIVAYRVCKDYDSGGIDWGNGKLHMSSSFVLVKHDIQPGENEESGLTFYTLYMNIAPLSAYAKQDGERVRKVASVQRYYNSKENTLAATQISAGSLTAGTLVKLSDNIISRSADKRQFTEVTIISDTANAAGATVAAGTKCWTVSDRGALVANSTAPQPSWWSKCSPAYDATSSKQVSATMRKAVGYYLSETDVQKGRNSSAGTLAEGFPLTYEPDNTAQQVTRAVMKRNSRPPEPTGAVTTFSLVTLGKDTGKLKKGERVWVVSDEEYITTTVPAATNAQSVTFGEVIQPSPVMAINAGDSIGHLGFYELPKDDGAGKVSRYQAHIECLSTDDVAKFITNPSQAGEAQPAFLKFQPEIKLFIKNTDGQLTDSGRKTKSDGIITLTKVPVIKEGELPKYYQIRQEGGWVAAADVQLISQYALADRGFVTLDKSSASFDLVKDKMKPDDIIKEILTQLEAASRADNRPEYALNQYNYQRLLTKIDSDNNGTYSLPEYLQGIQNASYRDRLHRIIAKHPSEWYYGKDAPMWQTYLNSLPREEVKWKTYFETFIEKMKWMGSVPGMGPAVWHMHPVVFSDGLSLNDDGMDLKWLIVPKGQLTFDAEGNDQNNSPWFSRKVHWPGGASGITIGRGYDLGHQITARADLDGVGIEEPLSLWLVESSGLSATNASNRLQAASREIRDFEITRKQQYNLFNMAYQRLEDDVRRISQKSGTINAYHPNPNVSAEQAWADIPDKIKEILSDLRYRGDYTPGIRSRIQRAAYTGDISGFGDALSNRAFWPNVPQDRFDRRVRYYEN